MKLNWRQLSSIFSRFLPIILVPMILNCHGGDSPGSKDTPVTALSKTQEWNANLKSVGCSLSRNDQVVGEDPTYDSGCDDISRFAALKAQIQVLGTVLGQAKKFKESLPASNTDRVEMSAIIDRLESELARSLDFMDQINGSEEVYNANKKNLEEQGCAVTYEKLSCPESKTSEQAEKLQNGLMTFGPSFNNDQIRRDAYDPSNDPVGNKVNELIQSLNPKISTLKDDERKQVEVLKKQLDSLKLYNFIEGYGLSQTQILEGYKKLSTLFNDPAQKPNLTGKIFEVICITARPSPFSYYSSLASFDVDPTLSLKQMAIMLRSVPGRDSAAGKQREKLKHQADSIEIDRQVGTTIYCIADSLIDCARVNSMFLASKEKFQKITGKFKSFSTGSYLTQLQTPYMEEVSSDDTKTLVINPNIDQEQFNKMTDDLLEKYSKK